MYVRKICVSSYVCLYLETNSEFCHYLSLYALLYYERVIFTAIEISQIGKRAGVLKYERGDRERMKTETRKEEMASQNKLIIKYVSLPPEYKKVRYYERNGIQYININYSPCS